MKRKSFEGMRCPVARSLERVGEWWSMLILRDAMMGHTRFEDFQRRLKISPGMLSKRLASLVEDGLLERRPYSEAPPRMEYVLTDMGRDVEPVLMALAAFGQKHFANDPEPGLAVVSRRTGKAAEIRVVDGREGTPVTWNDYAFAELPPRRARQSAAKR